MKKQLNLLDLDPEIESIEQLASSMTSATMVSGGRTSCYMAVHFPTDRYLFSPVLARDQNCRIEDDSLRKYCSKKVPSFNWDQYGSRELDLTLSNLRQLEQELGAEIEWVAAPFTYDDLIDQNMGPYAISFGQNSSASPILPNKKMRICTEALKVYPAAWHLYLTGDGNPYIVNIGFRADESRRVNDWKCDRTDMTLCCDITGKFKGKHRHNMLDYRFVRFPLHEFGVKELDVWRYWSDKGWVFPDVSNCDYCMFHSTAKQRTQYLNFPERSHWWIYNEDKVNHTFGDEPLQEILHGKPLKESGPLFGCLCTD